jgi:plastocyanin
MIKMNARSLRFLMIMTMIMGFSAPAAVAGRTIHVDIAKLTYVPAETAAHVGDTIEWTNEDFVAHTATFKGDGGLEPWDIVIAPGKTADLLIGRAGTVEYACRFHPNMKARIVVLPP